MTVYKATVCRLGNTMIETDSEENDFRMGYIYIYRTMSSPFFYLIKLKCSLFYRGH